MKSLSIPALWIVLGRCDAPLISAWGLEGLLR
jgi:hypothetical protein